MSIPREASDALWFLAPGLTHQLANALFAVQGRARLLAMEGGDAVADRDAILDGVGRANESLSVLRWLLAETHDEILGLGKVVHALALALRAPLRDRGFSLDMPEPAPETMAIPVPAAASCLLLCAATRHMIADATPTPGGTMKMELLAAEEPGGIVQIALAPEPGALPFPVDPAGVCERLSAVLSAAEARQLPAPKGTAPALAARQLRLFVPARGSR